MTALDSYAGNSTLGTEGILFLADIALAVGAKLEVAATSLYTRSTGWPVCNDLQQGSVNQVF